MEHLPLPTADSVSFDMNGVAVLVKYGKWREVQRFCELVFRSIQEGQKPPLWAYAASLLAQMRLGNWEEVEAEFSSLSEQIAWHNPLPGEEIDKTKEAPCPMCFDDESALFRLRMMWCEQPRLQDKDLFKCVGRVQNLFQLCLREFSSSVARVKDSCVEAPSKEEDSVKESGHSPEDEWEELEVAVSDPLLSLGDSPSAPLFSAAVCWTEPTSSLEWVLLWAQRLTWVTAHIMFLYTRPSLADIRACKESALAANEALSRANQELKHPKLSSLWRVVRSELGRALLQIGDIAQAWELFEEVERSVGSSAERDSAVLINKGLLFFSRGDFDGAMYFFDQALDLNSNDITACNNKALCQTFNTDLDGAIQTLETLIKRDPLKNLHPRLVANLCTLYDTVGHGSKERK